MKRNVIAMTECAVMIALSTVLSIVKIAELPYGGSITFASMLPIVIAVFRHGGKWGLGVSLVNATVQMLLGLKNFSYFTSVSSFIALAVFDYILAFSVFALSGVFKKRIRKQNVAMLCGVLLASVLRYGCHVIAGATIWAGLSIPTEAALIYSFSYNATYMLPETIVLSVACVYIASLIDFTRKTPTRIFAEKLDRITAFSYVGAGLSALVAIIVDTAIVFPSLQDPESGEFVFSNIKGANVTAIIISTAAGAVIAAALIVFAKIRSKRTDAR